MNKSGLTLILAAYGRERGVIQQKNSFSYKKSFEEPEYLSHKIKKYHDRTA